jgi:hypothetical protein
MWKTEISAKKGSWLTGLEVGHFRSGQLISEDTELLHHGDVVRKTNKLEEGGTRRVSKTYKRENALNPNGPKWSKFGKCAE